MRNQSIIVLLTIIFSSCTDTTHQTLNALNKTLTDTVYLRDSTIKFEYRDILEDYIDSIRPKDIKGLFGTWKITSIAKVGGSSESEELIQSQIGHKLHFNIHSFTFDFLDKSITVDKPLYSVVNFKDDEKGTSLIEGYRPCRKTAIMLDVSEKLYLEVIHFQEMVYYYDGRIYFLTRDN